MNWKDVGQELPKHKQEIIFIDNCDQVFHGVFLEEDESPWRPIYINVTELGTLRVVKWIDWMEFIRQSDE